MPFSDPMADGPAIQAGGPARAQGRADAATRRSRWSRSSARPTTTTPIVLMGYYNPIYIYGVDAFLADALAAGVDGLIVVDLPPEEDDELCMPALKAGLNFIRLATPTTDDRAAAGRAQEHLGLRLLRLDDRHHRRGDQDRMPRWARRSSASRAHTDLPVAVGFGIKTADDAANIGPRRRRRRGRHGALQRHRATRSTTARRRPARSRR